MDDVCYISYHTNFHDTRIDDHDMDMKEMMGKIDCIQEDLHNLVQLNQGSHAQDNHGTAAQRMDEDYVTQPMGFLGKPKLLPYSTCFFV